MVLDGAIGERSADGRFGTVFEQHRLILSRRADPGRCARRSPSWAASAARPAFPITQNNKSARNACACQGQYESHFQISYRCFPLRYRTSVRRPAIHRTAFRRADTARTAPHRRRNARLTDREAPPAPAGCHLRDRVTGPPGIAAHGPGSIDRWTRRHGRSSRRHGAQTFET